MQNKKNAHLLVTQTSCQGLRQSQDGGDAQGQSASACRAWQDVILCASWITNLEKSSCRESNSVPFTPLGQLCFFFCFSFSSVFACYIRSAASLFSVFFLEIFCGLFFDCCSIFVRNVGVTQNPNLVNMERRWRRRSPKLRNPVTSKIRLRCNRSL